MENINIIKKYRILKGLTQEELAELISLTPRQIQRIESNPSNTKISTLKKIINILNISDNDILKLIKKEI